MLLRGASIQREGPTKSQQHVASTYSTNEHEQVNSAVTPSTVPHVMSCHVVSCYGMLSYVILCYVMLYIAMLYLTRTWHLTTAIGSRSIYNKQKGQEYSRAPWVVVPLLQSLFGFQGVRRKDPVAIWIRHRRCKRSAPLVQHMQKTFRHCRIILEQNETSQRCQTQSAFLSVWCCLMLFVCRAEQTAPLKICNLRITKRLPWPPHLNPFGRIEFTNTKSGPRKQKNTTSCGKELWCRIPGLPIIFFWDYSPIQLGLSENRVYSQWNSHLIGIMIINHWV